MLALHHDDTGVGSSETPAEPEEVITVTASGRDGDAREARRLGEFEPISDGTKFNR
jgi:hypothetical protein